MHQNASSSAAPLIHLLLRCAAAHVAPASAASSDDSSNSTKGVASLGLPPLLATALEVLLRSPACEADLKKCAAELAAEAAAANAAGSPFRVSGAPPPALLAYASARLVRAIAC